MFIKYLDQSIRETHGHNDKIQPAPGVGEVTNVTHGQPLGQHLKYENDGEAAVHVVKRVLEPHALAQVHVLQGLADQIKSNQVRKSMDDFATFSRWRVKTNDECKQNFRLYNMSFEYERRETCMVKLSTFSSR